MKRIKIKRANFNLEGYPSTLANANEKLSYKSSVRLAVRLRDLTGPDIYLLGVRKTIDSNAQDALSVALFRRRLLQMGNLDCFGERSERARTSDA